MHALGSKVYRVAHTFEVVCAAGAFNSIGDRADYMYDLNWLLTVYPLCQAAALVELTSTLSHQLPSRDHSSRMHGQPW